MAISEFDLINNYFTRPELTPKSSEILGIGDDCAVFTVPANKQLAQSLDTLVAGVHFPHHCDPFLLGYRALAVNLSDLAAMGATPHSFKLGLTLPDANEQWLTRFSDGLSVLAQSADLALIGGDTTRGPLTITIQVQGLLPKGKALTRKGAQIGDKIYVSGFLGDAAGALDYVLEKKKNNQQPPVQYLLKRYYQPTPRLALGQWLVRNGATAALDISDGLFGDLKHILAASGAGASLNLNAIPLSSALLHLYGNKKALQYALGGGDDYELCFTWPSDKVLSLPPEVSDSVTCIGKITENTLSITTDSGEQLTAESYHHF